VPPPLATPSTPIFIKRPEQRRPRACSRFLKALAVALLVYFLGAAFLGSLTWRRAGGGGSSHWDDVNPEWPEYSGFKSNWEIAEEGCPNSWEEGAHLSPTDVTVFPDIDLPDWSWQDWNAPYHATTSFSLSPDAAKHLIVGNRAYGGIDVKTSNSLKDIQVDVTAHYYDQSVLEKARACKLKSKQDGEGVGLYMPRNRGSWHREDQVNFQVTVTLPEQSHGPLVINEFETHLSIFKHNLHDLRDKVFFRSLTLRSSNSKINADAVNAARSDVRTSNGGITGRYQVNDSLVLDTSNGRIDVELEVEDSGRRSSGASVVMKTSNAMLTAKANLYASQNIQGVPTTKSAKGGRFTLDATTSNGRLNLNVPTIPFDSALTLSGKTSNSPADVYLDKRGSFEGLYKLETSNSMPTVERADSGDKKDGQRRVLEKTLGGKGSSQGKVYWGRWDKGRDGSLQLKTSNSKVYASV